MKKIYNKIVLGSILTLTTNLFAASETLSIVNGYQIKATSSGVDDVSTAFNDPACIHSVWSYDTAWKVYTPNDLYKIKTDAAGIAELTTLSPYDGFWVITNSNQTCTIDVNSTQIIPEYITTTSGWKLRGSNYKFNYMGIFNNDKINIVWTFDTINNKWSAYSPDTTISNLITNKTTVDTINTIEANDGYWILANSDLTIEYTPFEYDSIEGWGSKVVSYDGITNFNTIITLPEGTYNIYTEISDGNPDIKAVIGTLQDINGTKTVDSNDVTGIGSLETIANSPANIQIQNSSGADKTYILPVSAKLSSNDNTEADNIHIAVINTTNNNYPMGAELTLGDVDTNTLMMLGVDESHTWYFTTPSDGAGTYTLGVTTDETVNKLMQFEIKMVQNGNGSELVNDSTSIGSFNQENITLEADTSYLVFIKTVPMQWDTIGKYNIKLIKN